MPRSHRHLALLVPLLACPGCCSLARLFCGPDRSEWVHTDYSTAASAAATVREALRRDDAIVLFRSLSRRFRKAEQIGGPLETRLLLNRLSKEVPLHMLGYADITDELELSDGRHRFTFTVEGRALEVTVVRQAYWEVTYEVDGEVIEDGNFLSRLDDVAELEDRGEGVVRVVVRTPELFGELMTLDRLVRAAVGHEWKLDDVIGVDDGS